MNRIANITKKAMTVVAATVIAGTSMIAVNGSAQAASTPAASSKPATTQNATYSIKRHYGPDNVMANRFETMWEITRVIDQKTGKAVAAKSIKMVYCQVLPSNLGWSGKGSCTFKRIPSGFLITNIAVFNSPRACIGTTCTPSISMTAGARIFLDGNGSYLREEPLGDSA